MIKIINEYKCLIKPYKYIEEDWIKIPDNTFKVLGNKPYEFLIYCYLCKNFNEKNGYAQVSKKTIARELEVNVKTVNKVIKFLEENELIKIFRYKKDNGSYDDNCYIINIIDDIIEDYNDDINTNNDRGRKKKTYNKWREKILKRDNYTCQLCGCKNNLHVHHILKYADNKELRYDINNGVTLCSECHYKTYGKEEEYIEQFKKIIEDKNQI